MRQRGLRRESTRPLPVCKRRRRASWQSQRSRRKALPEWRSFPVRHCILGRKGVQGCKGKYWLTCSKDRKLGGDGREHHIALVLADHERYIGVWPCPGKRDTSLNEVLSDDPLEPNEVAYDIVRSTGDRPSNLIPALRRSPTGHPRFKSTVQNMQTLQLAIIEQNKEVQYVAYHERGHEGRDEIIVRYNQTPD